MENLFSVSAFSMDVWNSQNSSTLSHAKYSISLVSVSKSKIFIGKIKSYKFGFTRFDHIDKKNYEVSIGILSKNYNEGLGTKLLKLSIKKFTKIYKPKKIVCLIIKTNKRSEQCFKKNNFKLIKFNKRKHKTYNVLNLQKDNYFEYFERNKFKSYTKY